MKAEFAEATGEIDLQVILTFENTEERLLAKKFIQFQRPKNQFCIHGYGGTFGEEGIKHLNFGFRKKRKKSVLQRILEVFNG